MGPAGFGVRSKANLPNSWRAFLPAKYSPSWHKNKSRTVKLQNHHQWEQQVINSVPSFSFCITDEFITDWQAFFWGDKFSSRMSRSIFHDVYGIFEVIFKFLGFFEVFKGCSEVRPVIVFGNFFSNRIHVQCCILGNNDPFPGKFFWLCLDIVYPPILRKKWGSNFLILDTIRFWRDLQK